MLFAFFDLIYFLCDAFLFWTSFLETAVSMANQNSWLWFTPHFERKYFLAIFGGDLK